MARQQVARDLLLDPATPPAGSTREAAVFATAPGMPAWDVLDALAVHVAALAGAAETP